MTKVIALANQKGGVGKTTSTVNLAHALITRGKNVLVIDIDPQASLTLSYGQDPHALEAEEKTLYFGLIRDKDFSSLIIEGTPSLIASSIHLANAEPELVMKDFGYPSVLREKLRGIVASSAFDYILLDCPPTLTLLTVNALAASDEVLIPCKTDYLSIMGIPLLIDTIEKIRTRANPNLDIFGVLPTMFNQRNSHDKEALEELIGSLNGKIPVFDPINRATGFDKAPTTGKATLELLPKTPGVQNYQLLADNLIEQNG